MINNGVDTKVYAPCSYSSKNEVNEEYLIQAKCFNTIDRMIFHYKYKKVYEKLMEVVQIKDYDLLHAHSLFSNGYIAYNVYKNYNIPYIVAIRNTDINVFFKYFIHLRKLGIEILKNAEKIIFISNSYKNKLFEKYIPKKYASEIEKKCIVIPNGIDDYFHNLDKQVKKMQSGKLNLVYTGKIDKNKNLITTIKCCEKILRNRYDLSLNVIGAITKKSYKRIINKYKFINYLGQKSKEEIVEIYKNMDIFVMPSKHETFGLSYVEAMSQGIPVIYTRNEGFDNFFCEGEVGYSVKYNDYNEMAEKIEKIIQNYQEISNNCLEKSLSFNWNDIALKYKKIYGTVHNR